MKKIDMHCHSTPRPLLGLASASASMETIEEKMREHDIEETILLASYFPHKGTGISNYRLKSWIEGWHESQQEPIDCTKGIGVTTFSMMGSLDFEHYFLQGYNELEEIAQTFPGIMKGIKVYTCYQEVDLASDKMQRVAKLAQQYKLPLLFHIGSSYQSMQTMGRQSYATMVKPEHLLPLADAHPNTKIILAHLGWPFINELIDTVKKKQNIMAEMSGLVDSKDAGESDHREAIQVIKRFLGECGPSKLLFGTDFPVQSHEDSVYFVEESMKQFSEEDRALVYYDNARRIFPCPR